MENRNIIIILLIVIIILLASIVGMFALKKEESNLGFPEETLKFGDKLTFSLSDSHGNPIAGEHIRVKLTDDNGNEISDEITTNSKGRAKLKIEDSGNYQVACSFDGNDRFSSASATGEITVNKPTTSAVDSDSASTGNTISVVPEFDKYVSKSDGEYTVKATKWKGGSVGGFEVSLYKNGQMMNRNSYQSRAYFNDGSGWKWSNWDDGEVSGATLHKYPVSNDVEIKEVEVMY